jgi:hypothetical protein
MLPPVCDYHAHDTKQGDYDDKPLSHLCYTLTHRVSIA